MTYDLPQYIDNLLKYHVSNEVITLNFSELRTHYEWISNFFRKQDNYGNKNLINVANICKLFKNSDEIHFIMPENYILTYNECVSLIKEDLTLISANDISTSIIFLWPMEMSATNKSRINEYQHELNKINWKRTFSTNSITFENIDGAAINTTTVQK
eukprot:349283_1